MTDAPCQWLLDNGLPRTDWDDVDVLHADDLMRVPGPVGIRDAVRLDRALVTCDQEFRGPWCLPLSHPGIVVLETVPTGGAEIARNLLHLSFRLRQAETGLSLEDNRFLVRADREIVFLDRDGSESDLAPWRYLRIPNREPALTF